VENPRLVDWPWGEDPCVGSSDVVVVVRLWDGLRACVVPGAVGRRQQRDATMMVVFGSICDRHTVASYKEMMVTTAIL